MDKKPILIKVIHLIIIGTFFVIPLFFTKQFIVEFTPEKTLLFYLLTEIIFSLWIISILHNKKYLPPKSPALLAGAVFLIFYTISGILSPSPEIAFWSTTSRMTGLIFLYHLAAFTLVLVSTIKEKETWRRILWSSILAATIVSIMSYLGQSGLNVVAFSKQTGSVLGNSSYAGTYLLFNFLLAILLFIQTKNRTLRIFVGLTALLILFCPTLFNIFEIQHLFSKPFSVLGESRAASGSLFLGLLLFISLVITQSRYIFLRYLFLVISGFIIILGVLGIAIVFIENTKPYEIVSQQHPGTRLVLWQSAKEGFVDKPLLGWGPENYFAPFYKYIDQTLFTDEYRGVGVNNDKPHNMYLEVAVTGGLLGLLFYFSIFYFLLSELRRKKVHFLEKAIISSMVFAYIIQNSLFFDTITSYLMLSLTIGYIASANQKFYPRITHTRPQAYLTFIVFIVSFWFFVYLPYSQQKMFAEIVKDPIENRANEYNRIISISPSGRFYSLVYLMSEMVHTIPDHFASLKEEERKVVLNEVQSVRKIAEQYIDNSPIHYQMVILFIRLLHIESSLTDNQKERNSLLTSATRHEKYLDALSPENPQNYWAKAQREIFEDKTEDAITTLNEAVTLYPEVKSTNEMLTAVIMYKGGEISKPYFRY